MGYGRVWLGEARQGKARNLGKYEANGMVRCGLVRLGLARQGANKIFIARSGLVRRGMVRRGWAWCGKARQGFTNRFLGYAW